MTDRTDSTDRIVHCFLLKKDLPGLGRPPFRNELGQRIYDQISKEAWQQWLKDSVKFINTYRVDLASSEGQSFMAKQCAIYFGFEKGDVAQTAWTPSSATDGKNESEGRSEGDGAPDGNTRGKSESGTAGKPESQTGRQ